MHNLDITLPPHSHMTSVPGIAVWAASVTMCLLTTLASWFFSLSTGPFTYYPRTSYFTSMSFSSLACQMQKSSLSQRVAMRIKQVNVCESVVNCNRNEKHYYLHSTDEESYGQCGYLMDKSCWLSTCCLRVQGGLCSPNLSLSLLATTSREPYLVSILY